MKIVLSLLLSSMTLLSWQANAENSLSTCMQAQLLNANDSITVGELKDFCQQQASAGVAASSTMSDAPLEDINVVEAEKPQSALENRIKTERENEETNFSLIPHKPNYIILSNNSSPNEKPFTEAFPDRDIDLDTLETKFQISVKVPLAKGLINNHGDLYAAYTGRFFWQQFNSDNSSPFRETNHEPELWLSFKNDSELWGFRNSVIRTGIVHQSNGQAGSLSRSWNRVFADFIVEKGNAYFSFKPWIRISEDFEDDDNPDIDDYMGNFELSGVYKMGEQSFSLMTRNNLDFDENRGAVEFGWTFPLSGNLKGYVQWFNGYGESLIDYNSSSNSIGVGVKISDWL